MIEHVTIRAEPLTSPVVEGLIAALDAELSARYPEDGATHFRLDAGEVAPGRGAVLVAYAGERAVGCGAVRLVEPGVAELKRMFVVPEVRGQGLAARLLAALEAQARALGAVEVVLETGVRQAEALALYRRAGYAEVAPFGVFEPRSGEQPAGPRAKARSADKWAEEYAGSPLSLCMRRRL